MHRHRIDSVYKLNNNVIVAACTVAMMKLVVFVVKEPRILQIRHQVALTKWKIILKCLSRGYTHCL